MSPSSRLRWDFSALASCLALIVPRCKKSTLRRYIFTMLAQLVRLLVKSRKRQQWTKTFPTCKRREDWFLLHLEMQILSVGSLWNKESSCPTFLTKRGPNGYAQVCLSSSKTMWKSEDSRYLYSIMTTYVYFLLCPKQLKGKRKHFSMLLKDNYYSYW